MTQPQKLPGPIKSVRVPMSDVEAAKSVTPPRFVRSESSRRFAVMGAAILEKMCRSGGLSVRARKTLPYILDTARGRTAISVMVSTVSGDPATKHMIVPLTSIPAPPGVPHHVIVCAFVSKHERTREANGGLNVKLAGWATGEEVMQHARVKGWVDSILKERKRLMEEFARLDCCIKVYPSDANFFLARVKDAAATYNYLVDCGIIVRNRSKIALCGNSLRVTIGTVVENNALLDALRAFNN